MKNNHIGEKFGRLEVLEYHKSTQLNSVRIQAKAKCKCNCGRIVIVNFTNLQSGNTKSCGCLKSQSLIQRNKDNIKHNKSRTRLYHIYKGMKHRCYNDKDSRYNDYGGRGIIMCDEWLNSFESFYNWSYENGYREGLSLDRINVNDNYSINNCRFISMQEQAQNRRNNVLNKEIVHKIRYYRDVEHKRICEICEILNLKEHYDTVEKVYNNKTWNNV